uniref:Uncharacterized protein n=1 Tax=Trichogramma kaykai TaxID=54128 RepID=A0ABD2X0R3_9HYME
MVFLRDDDRRREPQNPADNIGLEAAQQQQADLMHQQQADAARLQLADAARQQPVDAALLQQAVAATAVPRYVQRVPVKLPAFWLDKPAI